MTKSPLLMNTLASISPNHIHSTASTSTTTSVKSDDEDQQLLNSYMGIKSSNKEKSKKKSNNKQTRLSASLKKTSMSRKQLLNDKKNNAQHVLQQKKNNKNGKVTYDMYSGTGKIIKEEEWSFASSCFQLNHEKWHERIMFGSSLYKEPQKHQSEKPQPSISDDISVKQEPLYFSSEIYDTVYDGDRYLYKCHTCKSYVSGSTGSISTSHVFGYGKLMILCMSCSQKKKEV